MSDYQVCKICISSKSTGLYAVFKAPLCKFVDETCVTTLSDVLVLLPNWTVRDLKSFLLKYFY